MSNKFEANIENLFNMFELKLVAIVAALIIIPAYNKIDIYVNDMMFGNTFGR